MVARWTQNGNIWGFVIFALSLSLSLSLFTLLRFPYSLHSSSPTLPSIESTILMYNAGLIDATQTRNAQVQNDRQTLRRRNCLCSMLMSIRDGLRLGVSGSVSVRTKCLVSHIHSEECRLSYPLWSLAGRQVERSVTVLFSSISV